MKSKRGDFNHTACPLSRRQFILTGCAAGAGAMLTRPGLSAATSSGRKIRLRLVHVIDGLVQPKANWPNLGFDFRPGMEKVNHALENALPQFEFLHSTVASAVQAQALLLRDLGRRIDGYIIHQMTLWKFTTGIFAATGKPVLLADFIYGGSGETLVTAAAMLRKGRKNFAFVSSSSLDDLVEAVRCFELLKQGGVPDFAAAVARVRQARTPGPGDLSCAADPVETASPEECLKQARSSRILAVGYPGVSLYGVPNIPVSLISFGELHRAFKKADPDQAREVASGWEKSAAGVEGVSSESIQSSAAMYLGMKDLLQKHHANAITVNCLTGFYSGRIKAYPCLGFHQLCNDGLVGACECDLRSTATMILVTALTRGRPGFISDPVIDTSKRTVIYAHCVASNRPFGPKGPASPFHILTHSEDRKGASVRCILPQGYMTSTVEFDPDKKAMLFHRAKAIGNDPDDRACRTKLVAEPIGDIEKLFTAWDQWGWHRVTVYGDLKEPLAGLADALGYKVANEA